MAYSFAPKQTGLGGYKCMDSLQGCYEEQYTQKSFALAVGSRPILTSHRQREQH